MIGLDRLRALRVIVFATMTFGVLAAGSAWGTPALVGAGLVFTCLAAVLGRATQPSVVTSETLSGSQDHEHSPGDDVSTIATEGADFLTSLSQELRTPLNGLIGMADLLADSELSHEQRESCRAMQVSFQGLVEILDDLQDYSKLQLGELLLRGTDFELRSGIDHAVERVLEDHTADSLEFTYLITPSVPDGLHGDARRFIQVVENLMREVIHHVEDSTVHLLIEHEELPGNEVELSCTLRSTGLEFDLEPGQCLFQPFGVSGGAGLGLHVGRELARLMGGELSFHEGGEEPAHFRLTCRFTRLSEDSEARDESTMLSDLHVLIADSSEDVQQVLSTYLGAWGVTACTVSHASEVEARMREAQSEGRPHDVVLIADKLGEVDGMGLAASIKGSAALKSSRLVLLKGHRNEEKPSRLVRAGFDAWITKPTSVTSLRTALQHVVAEVDDPDLENLRLQKSGDHTGLEEAVAKNRLDVLLVEDNVVNQKVAGLLLKRFGCRVHVANHGLEAVEAVKETPFDLVLMDCQMPVMNGYEATEAIRNGDFAPAELPIVAMTARVMPGDREQCLEAGMNDYLAKPVQKDDLGRMLQKWGKARVSLRSPNYSSEDDMNDQTNNDVLDADVIAALRELGGVDDPGLFVELVELFLEDTPARMQDIQTALDTEDYGALERAAHALKSSAANLGALQLSDLCKEIEYAVRGENVAAAGPIISQATEEYARVQVALEKEIA